MKAIIIVNKQSIWRICDKTFLERNIDLLKSKGIKEIMIYPARYKKFLNVKGVKFLRSLKDLKEKVLIIKGNTFIEDFKLNGDCFIGEDGGLIACIGKEFKRRGKERKIKGFEIKNKEDVEKAKIVMMRKLKINPISKKLSFILCKSYVSQQISLVSFLISLISFLFIIVGKYIYAAFAGMLIVITAFLDECDDALANLEGIENKKLDMISDFLADFLLIVGIVFLAYKHFEFAWLLGLIIIGLNFILRIFGNSSRFAFLLTIGIGLLLYLPIITLLVLTIIALIRLRKVL